MAQLKKSKLPKFDKTGKVIKEKKRGDQTAAKKGKNFKSNRKVAEQPKNRTTRKPEKKAGVLVRLKKKSVVEIERLTGRKGNKPMKGRK